MNNEKRQTRILLFNIVKVVVNGNYDFSILAETVDRNNKKYQARFKKMEHQMLAMVERHTAQVSIV